MVKFKLSDYSFKCCVRYRQNVETFTQMPLKLLKEILNKKTSERDFEMMSEGKIR